MTKYANHFMMNFILLLLAGYLLFFISVEIYPPASELLRFISDPQNTFRAVEWIAAIGAGVFAGILWALCWIAFNLATKNCVEIVTGKRKLNEQNRSKRYQQRSMGSVRLVPGSGRSCTVQGLHPGDVVFEVHLRCMAGSL